MSNEPVNRSYKHRIGLVLAICAATVLVPIAAYAAVGDEPNDLIPGVPFTTDPMTGSLNSESNPDDVFSTSLTSGTMYNMTLVAPEDSAKGSKNINYALKLFGPTAANLDASPLVNQSGSPVNCAQYEATENGTFYLDAHASSGNGDYRLYMRPTQDAETSPGTRVGYGKYKDSNLTPPNNQFVKWFNVPIDSTKTQSVHMRKLDFPGAVAGDTHIVNIGVYTPSGDWITDGDLQSAGAITFKPNKIGLHFIRIYSCEPLSPQFSFAATRKLATETSLSSRISSKKRKGRYRAALTARVTPSQRKAKVRFTVKKCNSSGKVCKKTMVVTKRAKKRGKVKLVSRLRSGRYEATAKFLGSSKRLSSESEPECLAVGATGTCI